jgi:hypothetical protein
MGSNYTKKNNSPVEDANIALRAMPTLYGGDK